ncbi:hypothetical protein Ahy_B09g098271 [Arachis hypogaea]|uniref:Uncharacterized protein n=1 Tax=Arachis hypogaea TaxID=3818 RepID=A0A444XQV0_ARAHY|nr:hypothetical protein Ahy_B09g098271 [Arachis hypogaea]
MTCSCSSSSFSSSSSSPLFDSFVVAVLGLTMVGRANEGDGSSIRSTTRTPSRSRASRVPDRCGCGKRPVLRWSGTDAHSDKPFFGCPNYNVSLSLRDVVSCSGKRWCGFFRWADVVEDDNGNFEEAAAYNNEEISVSVAVRIGNLEAELRIQKYVIQMLALLIFFLLVVVVVVIVKM